MSIEEENKALMRRNVELLSQKDEAVWDLFAPDYVEHHGDRDVSLGDAKNMIYASFAAFPDAMPTLEDMVAEGDKIAYRITWRGTHKGEFMGIAPTGKKIKLTYPAIFRITGGKFVEWWGAGDTLMQQLGAVIFK